MSCSENASMHRWQSSWLYKEGWRSPVSQKQELARYLVFPKMPLMTCLRRGFYRDYTQGNHISDTATPGTFSPVSLSLSDILGVFSGCCPVGCVDISPPMFGWTVSATYMFFHHRVSFSATLSLIMGVLQRGSTLWMFLTILWYHHWCSVQSLALASAYDGQWWTSSTLWQMPSLIFLFALIYWWPQEIKKLQLWSF